MKKIIIYFTLILFVSFDAQALIGNKKHQSSPNHIYVSNKDSKDANVRFNIAKRHCSKYKKNTFSGSYRGLLNLTNALNINFRYDELNLENSGALTQDLLDKDHRQSHSMYANDYRAYKKIFFIKNFQIYYWVLESKFSFYKKNQT